MDSVMTVYGAWFLAISILLISIPYAFGSKETLARNSEQIGTRNLVAARITCVIGVFFGCMMVLVAAVLTYYYANAFFRADAVKGAKASEDGAPKR